MLFRWVFKKNPPAAGYNTPLPSYTVFMTLYRTLVLSGETWNRDHIQKVLAIANFELMCLSQLILSGCDLYTGCLPVLAPRRLCDSSELEVRFCWAFCCFGSWTSSGLLPTKQFYHNLERKPSNPLTFFFNGYRGYRGYKVITPPLLLHGYNNKCPKIAKIEHYS